MLSRGRLEVSNETSACADGHETERAQLSHCHRNDATLSVGTGLRGQQPRLGEVEGIVPFPLSKCRPPAVRATNPEGIDWLTGIVSKECLQPLHLFLQEAVFTRANGAKTFGSAKGMDELHAASSDESDGPSQKWALKTSHMEYQYDLF